MHRLTSFGQGLYADGLHLQPPSCAWQIRRSRARIPPVFASSRRNSRMKHLSAVSLCLLVLALPGLSKSAPKKSTPPAPDKAFLQKIWDGWSTLNPANVSKFY